MSKLKSQSSKSLSSLEPLGRETTIIKQMSLKINHLTNVVFTLDQEKDDHIYEIEGLKAANGKLKKVMWCN